jgi:hypothetical protein
MLAGSLLAAIAEASAWRSMWGWAANPTLAATRAKARLAWLGLNGVPRSVRNTRSNVRGRGGLWAIEQIAAHCEGARPGAQTPADGPLGQLLGIPAWSCHGSKSAPIGLGRAPSADLACRLAACVCRL